MNKSTVFKLWIGFELVSLVFLLRSFVRGDSVQSELAGLPPEVRARIESAFTLPSSDKLEAAATELDAYGLHTLAERVRQFASNLQGAS
jgi:hypothetical protein